MKTGTIRLLAVAGLVTAGIAGAVAPAQASVFGCATSTVCVYTGTNESGAHQDISGFAGYVDLNSTIHDHANSWINANNTRKMLIGEWRSGSYYVGQVLNAGWYEPNLGSVGFANAADFVDWA
ncbi:peptidase inhibitor family I36 protein [Arthrobacter sp. NPDC058130]|uniref:peptidase inhibitor family I36 protein n=1 Tax=Arthrobacter sp. NPDC058130 TaxID=3346353 RepID=UPI0036EFC4CA